jgi:hypothetical protein
LTAGTVFIFSIAVVVGIVAISRGLVIKYENDPRYYLRDDDDLDDTNG